LSIVTSWKSVLDDGCDLTSTSITEAATKPTIAWKTLNCCAWEITPGDIIQAAMAAHGSKCDVAPAVQYFNAAAMSIYATRELSALAGVTWPQRTFCQDETGLGLRPDWRPFVLAMKPLDGTLAHNAEQWGVAGMNIDAARIGDNPGYRYNADRNGTTFHGKQGERIKQSAKKKGSQFIESTKGRWPANLLLDEEAARLLDAQTGTLTSGSNNVRTKPGDGYHGGIGKPGDAQVAYGDSGGASRFFYTAKASRSERNKGCEQVVTWDNVDLSQETDELLQHARAISAIGMSLLDDCEWNTMLSGSNITDQSRTAIAFITSTLTRLITELRTFNFSPSSNTNASILAATRTLLATGLSPADIADNIDRLRTSTSGELASLLCAVSAALQVLSRISARGRRGNTHVTVKPLALMKYLLTLLSTPDGGLILDPFLGSGTTALAAKQLGRRCICVELDEHYCGIAVGRLESM
jgi:hypothetical protein